MTRFRLSLRESVGRWRSVLSEREEKGDVQNALVFGMIVMAEVTLAVEKDRKPRVWVIIIMFNAYLMIETVLLESRARFAEQHATLLHSLIAQDASNETQKRTVEIQDGLTRQITNLREGAEAAIQASETRDVLSQEREDRLIQLTSNLLLLTKLLVVLGVLTLLAAVITTLAN